MADTKIEWASKVWNPATGCDRISPGCDNCYALGMARRLKAMGQLGSQWARENGGSGKSGDWSAWPEDLRIRQFPLATESVTA